MFFGGCFANIAGWDLSACFDDVGLCTELFLDNQSNILGGRDLITVLLGQF